MHPVDLHEAVERALERSVVYRLFSVALRPPDEGLATLDGAQWETVLQAARGAGDEAAAAVEAARQAFAGVSADTLASEYDWLFGHRVGGDCPLYEAQYAAGGIFPQAQRLADIAGFYRAFGLDADDAVGERPDHISLELEFMHVLAYREAYARRHHGPDEVALLLDAQRAFVRDHLSRWVPALGRSLVKTADGPYTSLAAALAAWMVAELRALGCDPPDDPDSIPPPNPEGVEAEGAACCADQCPVNRPT
jgi:TorA maturation chaperone TorD